MTLLDRYIARQYLTNIIVLLAILFSFVVVVDVSLNLGRFIKIGSELAAQQDGAPASGFRRALVTATIIADLWWPKLLQLFNFMIGLVLVAAMGFTCTQLSRNREFIAMLAAGVSLRRVGRPIMVVAIILCGLQLANRELLIPRIAPMLERDHNDAGRRGLAATSMPLTPDGQGRLIRAERFDADRGVLSGVFILERNENGRAVRAITADEAVWANAGWDLTAGFARPRGPRAGDGSNEPEPVTRVESGLGPDEIKLNAYKTYRNAISFRQASQLMRLPLEPDARERLDRIRWGRIALIMSNLLTLIIAMPFFVTREPVNMVVQSLKCAPFSIFALMGGAFGSAAGIPGLPAVVAVFIPVMLLTTVAVGMRSFVKT